jgi:MFS family permease
MGGTADYSIWRVILASSVGTMIEWYDFYIFGSLAVVLSQKFYPPGNATFAYIAYLATFAVGFMVRPFGALFFGRIGDLVGRKYAFLVTLTVMGFGTFLIGLMPTFATAGWFAPIALIAIRVFQGLALGGEYGGAAIYVAEHVPDNKRGYWLYSDYGNAGPVLFRYHCDPPSVLHDASKFPELRLAHSLPGFRRPGHDLALHPS